MTRTLMITGATGSVSSALIDALAGAQVKLRALVRNVERASRLRERGIELVEGDLDDPASLEGKLDGVQDLWLLTAVGPRAPENSMNGLWAARRAGVERVVRMSAIGAAHDAPTRNGRLHALSDAELASSGLRYTVVKPHYFMQNLLYAADGVARDGVFYQDMGDARLGMIDVRDIGEFAAKVLLDASGRHDGKTYTLTGPESVSFETVAARLSETLGRAVRYQPVTHEALRASLLGLGFPKWLADMMIEYGTAYGNGWGDFTTDAFESVVGRPPRGIAEFVRDHAQAFRGAAGSTAA
jgi:uncharacterized protein YbjT (DUF2867 family)